MQICGVSMDWDDVRFFLALASARAVKGAAKTLGVDTSTVTRRIATLEEKVGRLFERNGATYVLSVRGEMMLASAERISREMEDLAGKMARFDLPKTNIRVSFPTLLSSLVLEVVRGFSELRPDLTLSLEASDERVSLEESADVVVRIEDKPSEELVGRRVGALRVGVFAAPVYFAEHSYPIDDARHGWVTWSSIYDEKGPMRFLRQRFPNVRVVSEGASGEAVFQAIVAGLGVGAIPTLVAERAGLVELYELPVDASPSVWVLSSPNADENEAVRAVKNHLFGLTSTLRETKKEVLRAIG